ncbi:MAG: hypothetical protein M8364_06815 [Methylobacter sp.]|uniref:hypothetical protein n=1 Tax=Methylobacter sp. TaxID=2051955 RepID=UPI00258E2D59|nr:hypothetical protein [Methylobacter sp.]MCL7420598.1 hypothetical protein [Methylobacter sp.]
MTEDLEEKLYRDYPSLYRNRQQTLMSEGVSCGDGWFALIDAVSFLLSKHDQKIRVEQVKEKLGALNFYVQFGDKYSTGITMLAYMISQVTCEICGSLGARYEHQGWLTTRCPCHRPGHEIREIDVDCSSVDDLELGFGWALLVKILLDSAKWHTEHNAMPAATISVKKIDGQLLVEYSNGNEMTRGMVDFINFYARRIDECSGQPIE